MKMPFGKHKGIELEELAKKHPSYVVWLAEKCELHGDLFYFVGENYEACKSQVRKNNNYLWSDEDIAAMEDDMRDEWGENNPYDWEISYPIPNFDY
jgi:hypothetical protein